MCSVVATKQPPKNIVRRFRYVSLVLSALIIIGVVLLVSFRVYSSLTRNISNTELCGNWVGPTGNTTTIRPDGTAVSGGTSNYNWSIERDVLTFEPISDKRSLGRLVRRAAEVIAATLTNRKAGESFRIIESSRDSFTVLSLGDNKPLTLERIDNLNLETQTTASEQP